MNFFLFLAPFSWAPESERLLLPRRAGAFWESRLTNKVSLWFQAPLDGTGKAEAAKCVVCIPRRDRGRRNLARAVPRKMRGRKRVLSRQRESESGADRRERFRRAGTSCLSV